MIVYREEVEKFRSVSRGKLYDRKEQANDPSRGVALSFASGNTFESLAKTNPEEFNNKVLKAMKDSENLVEAFNIYYQSIYNSIYNKGEEWMEKFKPFTKGSEMNNAYMFNVASFSAVNSDAITLAQYFDNPADATKAVTQMYLPESLTEEGCKKLIDTRLKNNKLLTDSLVKMLKTNYMALNITSAEAASLIEDLQDDEKNGQAIGKIKEFLLDPKKLVKFKMGKSNYDFRSIGGGCMFLSNDPSIQFSQHPSKNLSLIFKYDAIVIGHGDYNEKSSASTAKDIKSDSGVLFEKLSAAIKSTLTAMEESMKQNEKDVKFIQDNKEFNDLETRESYRKTLISEKKLVNEIKEELLDILKRTKTGNSQEISTLISKTAPKIYKYMQALAAIGEEDVFHKLDESYKQLIKYSNLLKAKADPKQAMKDGTAADWIVQPISTLTTSNNVRMIDIIRNLKKEGFKNIFIGACNPGNVQLPADIRNDKNFKVSMGSACVYMENTVEDDEIINDLKLLEATFDSYIEDNRYRRMSIDELFTEYNYLNMIIHESVGSAIKAIVSKAIQIIAAIWKRIVEFFRNIYGRIKEFISSKFGDKSKTKTKKPVEVWVISMNGDKAKFDKKTCNSPEEIMNLIQSGNATISAYIKDRSAKENEYIKKLQDLVNSGKLKKDQPKAQSQQQTEKHESSIFDGVIMI